MPKWSKTWCFPAQLSSCLLVTRAEDWTWSSAWARCHNDDWRGLATCQWPLLRPEDWLFRVNAPLTDAELAAVRSCAERGPPYAATEWVEVCYELTYGVG